MATSGKTSVLYTANPATLSVPYCEGTEPSVLLSDCAESQLLLDQTSFNQVSQQEELADKSIDLSNESVPCEELTNNFGQERPHIVSFSVSRRVRNSWDFQDNPKPHLTRGQDC